MAGARRDLYDSARVAAGYAFARPPIHHHIVERIGARLGGVRVARALDLGCGAGASTAALDRVARTTVGLDPAPAMLAHHAQVAPRARFVVGRAEALPFARRLFDLITAAGAINYTDLDRCLPEIERVLAPGGVLAIYDFSAGRRIRGSTTLDEWYAGFQRRYPPVPGYDLDVRELPYARAGLRLDSFDEMQVPVTMDVEAYLRYAMSETNVELAVSRGTPEKDIEEWCHATLDAAFGGGTRDVLFDSYVACVRRDTSAPAE